MNRAWRTSRTPGTGGFQARTVASSLDATIAGSYKTGAGSHAYGPAVETWIALVGFSFVSSVTPGPNNILLWASGASFGFRRTVPHVAGTALGIGAMALARGRRLERRRRRDPGVGDADEGRRHAYLLYLAVRVARSGTLQRGESARPLGLLGAAGVPAREPEGLDLRASGRSPRSARPSCRRSSAVSSWPSR